MKGSTMSLGLGWVGYPSEFANKSPESRLMTYEQEEVYILAVGVYTS